MAAAVPAGQGVPTLALLHLRAQGLASELERTRRQVPVSFERAQRCPSQPPKGPPSVVPSVLVSSHPLLGPAPRPGLCPQQMELLSSSRSPTADTGRVEGSQGWCSEGAHTPPLSLLPHFCWIPAFLLGQLGHWKTRTNGGKVVLFSEVY